MWILPVVGYAGIVVGFCFLTLSIASGLYYLSELVEEHTVISKRILTRLIQSIISIHVLLILFDGFPILLTLFSTFSHGIYMLNLRRFPIVKLTDEVLILSCILAFLNHFFWFHYFSNSPQRLLQAAQQRPKSSGSASSPLYDYSSSDPYLLAKIPSFTEISSFFGICVWLIPFALFVSLSAGENVLPSSSIGEDVSGMSSTGPDGKRRRGGPGMAKMVVDKVKEWFGTGSEALGLTTPVARSRRFD